MAVWETQQIIPDDRSVSMCTPDARGKIATPFGSNLPNFGALTFFPHHS